MTTTHRYATYNDIAARVPELTTVQNPTKPAVEELLTMTSRTVDGWLDANGENTPATNSADTERIRYYVVCRVSADVKADIYRHKAQNDPQIQQWNRQWDMFMKMLEAGTFKLTVSTSDYDGNTGTIFGRRGNRA